MSDHKNFDLIPVFSGTNYKEYRNDVLLRDSFTGVDSWKRPQALTLRLKDQPRQILHEIQGEMISWVDHNNQHENNPSAGVKRFLGELDKHFKEDSADEEFKDICNFLEIKRNEASLTSFLTRYGLARTRFSRHVSNLSKNVESSILLRAANLGAQDKKLVLTMAGGDLSRTDDIIHALKRVVGNSTPASSHFVEQHGEHSNLPYTEAYAVENAFPEENEALEVYEASPFSETEDQINGI